MFFLSRIMLRQGLVGYNHFRFINRGFTFADLEYMAPQERIGPPFVLVFYFDNLQSCVDFSKSKDLAAFRSALSPYYPEGLKLKWDVNYKLIGSWQRGK